MVNIKKKVIFQGEYILPKQDLWSEFLVLEALTEGYLLKKLVYTFVSREMIREANIKYLKHDYDTDVITFDFTKGKSIKGEVLVCVDVIEENATWLGVSKDIELKRVILHALLHLVGYRDKTEKEKVEMRSMEDKWLKDWESHEIRV